jgi:hypothetical protein
VDLRASLDAEGRREILYSCWGLSPSCPGHRQYSDFGTAAHTWLLCIPVTVGLFCVNIL